jgi:8-oxo-dGTP pyrophosphatase MutT (NUDIX family)
MKMTNRIAYQETADIRPILPEEQRDLEGNLYQSKPLDRFVSHVTQIVHVHILTNDGKVAVFQRSRGCGRWSCVSGEVEVGESWEDAAIREVREETKLNLRHIILTNHIFAGISPTGKLIIGLTCFAIVSSGYLKSSGFHFNGELKRGLLLSYSSALDLIKNCGFKEAADGFEFIMKHHSVDHKIAKQSEIEGGDPI